MVPDWNQKASNDSRSEEQELELMKALQVMISRDDSALAWSKRKDALCFVRFVVDRIPTPLLDIRRMVRELIPPLRKIKITTENKPNGKHHKMCRQFSKPPGQLTVGTSREYPRATPVEGDDRRYQGLETPRGDSLFAA